MQRSPIREDSSRVPPRPPLAFLGPLGDAMTPAESEVRRRIEERGFITFAEFMDLALYWPRGGYYSSGDPIGPGGDYYTSPQVHPVFATLLAVQLFQMWELLDRPDPFTVVELGAGNGLLGRDLAACWDSLHLQIQRRPCVTSAWTAGPLRG